MTPDAPTRSETDEYIRAARDMATGQHGGFCAGLGESFLAADPANRIRLLVAFSAEFEHVAQSLDDDDRMRSILISEAKR